MTNENFLTQLQNNIYIALDIVKRKNADYASAADPFKNFRGAEFLNLTVEQGILLRMFDKISRISNLIKSEPQVKEESIDNDLIDLMNYSNILLVYLQSKQSKK